MAEMKKEGKVREIGVSNHGVIQMERLRSIHPIASLQPPYSMLNREVEEDPGAIPRRPVAADGWLVSAEGVDGHQAADAMKMWAGLRETARDREGLRGITRDCGMVWGAAKDCEELRGIERGCEGSQGSASEEMTAAVSRLPPGGKHGPSLEWFVGGARSP